MATSLDESKNWTGSQKIHANACHLVKKLVKIGPVYTEIALLILKRK